MFKKILVPLDGSRLSAKALPYAIEVAKQFKSEVILMQVVTPATPVVPISSEMGMVTSPLATQTAVQIAQAEDKRNALRAQRYLKAKMRQVTNNGIEASYHISIGSPAKSILDYCRKNKVDLVVMTTSGRSGLKRAILGSVADKVIRDPRYPVLVIRPQARRKK